LHFAFCILVTTASAPAKLILCGEHAVVYGRPAIALPLADLRAFASVEPAAPGAGLRLVAADLGSAWDVAANPERPLSELALATLAYLGRPTADLTLTLRSAIPIASGMGSGAALGTALARALADWAGVALAPAQLSKLVYASERRYHGTPSGIDNTVVAFEQAIWFERGLDDRRPTTDDRAASASPSGRSSVVRRRSSATHHSSPLIEPIAVGAPLTLLVGDTGVRSATMLPVGAVRERWQAEPAVYEARFDAIGALVAQARVALATGDSALLGRLLDSNQRLLEQLGVSSPELERLVAAARAAGALGAKLSGAGWGGVMLALVTPQTRPAVEAALRAAGATQVLATTVS